MWSELLAGALFSTDTLTGALRFWRSARKNPFNPSIGFAKLRCPLPWMIQEGVVEGELEVLQPSSNVRDRCLARREANSAPNNCLFLYGARSYWNRTRFTYSAHVARLPSHVAQKSFFSALVVIGPKH